MIDLWLPRKSRRAFGVPGITEYQPGRQISYMNFFAHLSLVSLYCWLIGGFRMDLLCFAIAGHITCACLTLRLLHDSPMNLLELWIITLINQLNVFLYTFFVIDSFPLQLNVIFYPCFFKRGGCINFH